MTKSLPLLVRDLTFELAGKRLLDVQNLTLHSAGPTMILGPNGAGKSLLLRLLHGLLSPSSGSIRFAAEGRQAMVFQKPVILRRSVAANVDYALNASGQIGDVLALLAMAGLERKADQPARSLSGGEQQLLAVVRALATNADVLFLDEPTSSLDPNATQRIEAMIQRANGAGTKIIWVTHDIGQAKRLADEVLFCHQGRIIEQADANTFFTNPRSDAARQYLVGELVIEHGD